MIEVFYGAKFQPKRTKLVSNWRRAGWPVHEVNHRRGNHRFPPVYFHMHVRATSLHAAAARRVLLFPKEFAHVRGCVTYARAPWNFKRARRKRRVSLPADREWKSLSGENCWIFLSRRERENFTEIQFPGMTVEGTLFRSWIKILRVFSRRDEID